ncbi:hypothetical protein D9M68_885840 [compost metagenome]
MQGGRGQADFGKYRGKRIAVGDADGLAAGIGWWRGIASAKAGVLVRFSRVLFGAVLVICGALGLGEWRGASVPVVGIGSQVIFLLHHQL